MATSDLEIEGQGHKTIAFVALPIYTHIPNLKVLTEIFFKLSRPKGNLCGGGGVTVLNPKYPRLSSRDTIKCLVHVSTEFLRDCRLFLATLSIFEKPKCTTTSLFSSPAGRQVTSGSQKIGK